MEGTTQVIGELELEGHAGPAADNLAPQAGPSHVFLDSEGLKNRCQPCRPGATDARLVLYSQMSVPSCGRPSVSVLCDPIPDSLVTVGSHG